MPVLLTGGEGPVGRAAAARLRAAGGEVRAFVDLERVPRPDPEPLRRLGCKVALGALDDEGHLESAMEQVHTVLHLAGSLVDDPDDLVERAATVVSAAIGAGVRRLVALSWLGADRPDGAAHLEACAEVEGLVAAAPLEGVVVRRGLTYGLDEPLVEALAAQASAAELAGADQWPLWAGDLADVVVACDRERVGTDAELHLVVATAGPDRVPLTTCAHAFAAALRTRGGRTSARKLPACALELLQRELPPPPGALGASARRWAAGSALLAASTSGGP